MEPIAFEAHGQLGDYRQAYRTMQPRLTYFIAASALCLIILIFIIATAHDAFLSGALGLGAAFLGFSFANNAYQVLFAFPKKAVRRVAQQEPIVYTFDETGVTLRTNLTQWITAWRAFTQFYETSDTLVFVFPSTLFLVIPKRDVPIGRLDDLRTLSREKIAQPSA